jgi:hypothetical protein
MCLVLSARCPTNVFVGKAENYARNEAGRLPTLMQLQSYGRAFKASAEDFDEQVKLRCPSPGNLLRKDESSGMKKNNEN